MFFYYVITSWVFREGTTQFIVFDYVSCKVVFCFWIHSEKARPSWFLRRRAALEQSLRRAFLFLFAHVPYFFQGLMLNKNHCAVQVGLFQIFVSLRGAIEILFQGIEKLEIVKKKPWFSNLLSFSILFPFFFWVLQK